MRLPITNAEAMELHELLQQHAPDSSIIKRLEDGLERERTRNEFEIDGVRCVRTRGSEFKPACRGGLSSRHGWVLTHVETGKTDDLRPCAGSGIPRTTAERYARQFAKLVALGVE